MEDFVIFIKSNHDMLLLPEIHIIIESRADKWHILFSERWNLWFLMLAEGFIFFLLQIVFSSKVKPRMSFVQEVVVPLQCSFKRVRYCGSVTWHAQFNLTWSNRTTNSLVQVLLFSPDCILKHTNFFECYSKIGFDVACSSSKCGYNLVITYEGNTEILVIFFTL